MASLGILALGGLVAFLVTWFVVDYSIVGFTLVLFVQLLAQVFGVENGLVGSIHFGLGDGIAGMLMFTGVLRFIAAKKSLNVSSLLLITYPVLVFFSLVRGIVIFGIHDAGNEARTFFDIAACFLYFSTFPPTRERIEQYFRIYTIFATLLILTAIARLAGILPANIEDPVHRPLPAMGAYSICLAFLICLVWVFYGNAPRYCRWLTPVFAGVAIALQHRTVWVVIVGLIVALYKLERCMLRKLMPAMIVSGFLVLVIGAVVYGSKVRDQFYDSSTNSNTLMWRIEGWTDLIENSGQTALTYAVGEPFGAGYTRYVDGAVVDAGTHDDYLAEFLRVGIVGLIVFLLMLLRPMLLLYRRRNVLPDIYPHPLFWVLFALSLLLWNLTYNLTLDQAAFIGVLTSIMMYLSEKSRFAKVPALEQNLPLLARA